MNGEENTFEAEYNPNRYSYTIIVDVPSISGETEDAVQTVWRTIGTLLENLMASDLELAELAEKHHLHIEAYPNDFAWPPTLIASYEEWE